MTPNENKDEDTLHGGVVGTSRSGWSLLKQTSSQLVFGLLDANGTEGGLASRDPWRSSELKCLAGFPGTVYIKVNYTVSAGGKWTTTITADAYDPTPILLSSHVYWNLDGWKDSQTIKNHTLFLKSKEYIMGDGIEASPISSLSIMRVLLMVAHRNADPDWRNWKA